MQTHIHSILHRPNLGLLMANLIIQRVLGLVNWLGIRRWCSGMPCSIHHMAVGPFRDLFFLCTFCRLS